MGLVRAIAVAASVWVAAAAPTFAAQQPGETRSVEIVGTGQSLELVFVPAGVFRLGSAADEVGRDADEGPVRTVRLPGFWMGTHEVTYDQYAPFRFRSFDDDGSTTSSSDFDADAVTRPSPPYEDPGHGMPKGDHPATGMTRMNALHYARWLSEKTGRLFRLPTEAEWEYACRAGGETPFGTVEGARLAEQAWFEANSGGSHHPVGSKAPNGWGLFDMSGNVAEWVGDGFLADAYARLPEQGEALEPRAGDPLRGQGVVRGGAFDDPPSDLRCAARFPETPAWKRRDPQIPKSSWWNTDSPHVGFRLVSPAHDYSLDEIRAYWAEILPGE